MSKETEDFFRLAQQFLAEHSDEYDSTEDAMQAFIKEYNTSIDLGNTQEIDELPENKSMDLFQRAQFTEDEEERRELLSEAVEVWPENWEAHAMLIEGNWLETIEQYEKLEAEARKDWQKNTYQEGYLAIEERPYLRVKYRLAGLYLDAKLYEAALKEFLEIYNLDENDSLGTRYKILSIYANTFDWKNAWKFYKKAPYADEDDQMLLPIIVLAVLTRREDLAQKLFKDLIEVNSDVSFLTVEGDFPIPDILHAGNVLDSFSPSSYDTVLLSLHDILPLLIRNRFLYNWFEREIEKNPEIFKSDGESNSQYLEYHMDDFDNEMSSLLFDGLFDDETDDPYDGITIERIQILLAEGFSTFEDFEDVSEKELLSIKGIGKATIQTLKENGVLFKDDI